MREEKEGKEGEKGEGREREREKESGWMSEGKKWGESCLHRKRGLSLLPCFGGWGWRQGSPETLQHVL